jgi:uncharacterized protein (DUF58 family)
MIPRELIKKVKRIELITRRKASNRLAGQYHSVFKGRGMDFDEVQPYAEGDDVRFIDWNVSARTGDLHVKHFVEERELTVMLLVDISGSVEFGSSKQRKREIIAEIGAILAFSAIRNNDRVGLVIFTDDVQKYIPPKKGRKHVLRIVTEILNQPAAEGGTDIGAALEFTSKVQRRQSVVFILSDFMDQSYERGLKISAKRHDVVPLVVQDPLEWELPKVSGLLPVRDLESGDIRWLDPGSKRQREAFHESRRKARQERENLFRRLKLDRVEIDVGRSYVDRLAAFFRRRAKRY